MSLVTIKPTLSLSFDAEFWNSEAVKAYTNCFPYAFNSVACGCSWFTKIPELELTTDSAYNARLLVPELIKHPSFEQIHRDSIPQENAHVIAVANTGSHVYRYNNLDGSWAEKMPDIEARMWDDAGNPLINLESAFWRYSSSRPSVTYFKFEKGFDIISNVKDKKGTIVEDESFYTAKATFFENHGHKYSFGT